MTTDETYAYDQASRLLTLNVISSGKSETTTFDYDGNGNQVRTTGPKGSTTFSYDFENRLLEQHFPDGSTVAHRYNGSGQRLYTRDADQETYYLYDRGNIAAKLDGSGALMAGYFRDLAGRLVSTHQRTGTYLYQADGLGSIIGLTKADGSWDSQYTYDEFGVVSSNKGQAWNNFEYTGAPYQEASGLYHLGARYYNPSIGRFITQDTYKGSVWQPWTQNLYTYVGNNPVNYIDPTGHFTMRPFRLLDGGGGGGLAPLIAMSANWLALNGQDAVETAIDVKDVVDNGISGPGLAAVGADLLALGSPAPAKIDGPTSAVVAKGGVYTLRVRDTGEVVRTGRSKDLAKRRNAHNNDPVLGKYDFKVEYRTDNHAQQRGLEQIEYDKYPGAKHNYIRPISPRRPEKMKEYMRAAYEFLSQ